MDKQTRTEQLQNTVTHEQRTALLSANDINHILVNGAQISSIKLKRAGSYNARLFYFAEIGVYLEVSLSDSSGITDDTRDRLGEIHQQALNALMAANREG